MSISISFRRENYGRAINSALLAAGLGVVKQQLGSYAVGLWLFAAVTLAASLCLVGVKQRWRLHWTRLGAARV